MVVTSKPPRAVKPMKPKFIWMPLIIAALLATAAAPADTPRLKISQNQRFLVTSDDSPFFWLGDTAWELFHRLNREEADRYLANRAANGYTVIQAVALAELDGLHAPNPYGHRPLIDDDPTRPDVKDGAGNDYWDHVDYIVKKAEALGMYIAMLPTWGDKWNKKWGVGPVIFTPQNAEAYGLWLGRRYKDAPNIIWILGGDRPVENDDHAQIIRAMARGIRKGDDGRHLISFHPSGGAGSAQYFHNEDWLDFNMRQNGHNAKFNEGFHNTKVDYDRTPIKPMLDGEPIYEDHPVSFRPKDLGHSIASDVRRPLYWNLFTGAFGHTYGHHSVWQMWQPGRAPVNNPLMPWYDAIEQPGAMQMQFGRRLIESRPFLTRIPDDSIIVAHTSDGAQPPTARKTLVDTKLTHVVYTRDQTGKAALCINGDEVSSGNVGGDLSNWDDGFRLAMGNELTEDRPWLGELYRVALHARALDAPEIARSFATGPEKIAGSPIALYEFREGGGRIVKDTSGVGEPLNLQISNASNVNWRGGGGGLRLAKPALIASQAPATKLINAVKHSRSITIEAWIRPDNTVQAGPARIVTLSKDMTARNFTLGQKGDAYEVRFRTTATSPNGEPALSTPGGDTPTGLVVPTAVPGAGRYRFVATRDASGSYAMVYAPVSRAFAVRMDVISGPNVKAWWYNPRNGQATEIGQYPNKGQRRFQPPDKGEMLDWVLVLDDASKKYPAPGARK